MIGMQSGSFSPDMQPGAVLGVLVVTSESAISVPRSKITTSLAGSNVGKFTTTRFGFLHPVAGPVVGLGLAQPVLPR